MKLNPLALFVLGTLILAGCRRMEPHPWTRNQPDWRMAPRASDGVSFIGTNQLTWVDLASFSNAVSMLESVSFVELKAEQLKALSANPANEDPEKKPYLLRGVTWSHPPLYTRVYWETHGTTLCVEQYTYNGEIYLPGRYASGANPIIAFLDRPPQKVVPRAIFGGDHIALEMLQPYAWTEPYPEDAGE